MRNIHDPIQAEQEDLLERTSLAKEILFRLSDDNCPSVLGIYGGWGTGKSSLLNLILSSHKSNNKKNLYFELFDAWKYEVTGNLLIPILVRLSKLSIKGGTRYAKKIIKITSLFLTDLALRRIGNINISDVATYRDELKNQTSVTRWAGLIDEIENTTSDFEKLVNLVLEHKKAKRLVIFIDNLDRCFPENTIHLLESVKNLLNVEGCTWVISVDNNVIASYINQKYHGTKVDGHNYLEKIVTEQYSIPSIGSYYTAEILAHLEIYFDTDLDSELDFDRLSHLITPRKIIRAALQLKSFLRDTWLQLTDKGKKYVFGLFLLYNLWPEFYEYLSTGSTEHVSGVLANFYGENMGSSDEKIPLPEKFNDKNLTYFIQTMFIRKFGTGVSIGNSQISAGNQTMAKLMNELKEFGLP